jgi:predicted phage terminase large subunit-like protein
MSDSKEILDKIVNKIKISPTKTKAIYTMLREKCLDDFFYFAHDFMNIKSFETGKKIIWENPHKEVCDLLTILDKNVMILLPREFGKTFLAELFIIWYSIKCPNKTILLFSQTSTKAKEILTAAKLIMNTHNDFKAVFGEDILAKRRNTKSELCLKARTTTDKEPNVLAFGIETSLQGYRADLMIFEDIIGDTYPNSDAVKRDIDNIFFNATVPLLKKQGQRIYIGTRWDYDDIPGQIIRSSRLKKKWEVISKSIENSKGESAFPHIISNKQLNVIRETVASNAYYSSQYLNHPKNRGSATFNVEKYLSEYAYTELPPLKKTIMAVDLAYSTTGKGDDRAIVVIGIDAEGYIYLVDVYNDNKISTTTLYFKIKTMYKRWKPSKVLVETNNAEPIFNDYKMKSFDNKDYIPFIGVHHDSHKESRIENLEWLLDSGILRLPAKSIYVANKYMRKLIDVEMEFFARNSKNKDDSLDALETACNEAKKVRKVLNSTVSIIETRDYHGEMW